jgi:hypothetical protein
MNKKEMAIVLAYDSLVLKQKAEKAFEKLQPDEKEVLLILDVLQRSYSKEFFSFGEIMYVGVTLFWDHSNFWISGLIFEILEEAQKQGKVISVKGEWKLAPKKEMNPAVALESYGVAREEKK